MVLGLAGAPPVAAQASGTHAHLQAVAAVSDSVAWVSGRQGTYARTTDGGVTWTAAGVAGAESLGGTVPFQGAVYAVAWLPSRPDSVVAAGPKGLALSTNWGKTWTLVDAGDWWSVGFAPSGAGWAVGPAGRIARLELR